MTKESTSSANLPFLRHVSLYSRIIIILSLLLSILEFVRQCLRNRSVNFKNRIGICHFTFFFLPLLSLALIVLAATRKNSGRSGAATVKAALRRMWARPSSWTRTAGSTSVRELDKSTNSPWSRRYLFICCPKPLHLALCFPFGLSLFRDLLPKENPVLIAISPLFLNLNLT